MRLFGDTFSRIALALGVSVAALCSSPAIAQSIVPPSSHMPSGSLAEPPQGYLDFCVRHSDQCAPARLYLTAGSAESAVAPGAPGDDAVHPASTFLSGSGQKFDWQRVFASTAAAGRLLSRPNGIAGGDAANAAFPVMTVKFWQQLESVNRTVNVSVRSVSDIVHYGLEDYWELPFQSGQNAGDCEDYVLQKRQMLLARGIPMSALSIALAKTPWGEPHAVLLVRSSQGDYVLDNLTPWIKPWTEVSYSWIKWQSGDNPEAWERPSIR